MVSSSHPFGWVQMSPSVPCFILFFLPPPPPRKLGRLFSWVRIDFAFIALTAFSDDNVYICFALLGQELWREWEGHLLFVFRAPSPIHYSDSNRLTKWVAHEEKQNQVIGGVMLWGWAWLEAPLPHVLWPACRAGVEAQAGCLRASSQPSFRPWIHSFFFSALTFFLKTLSMCLSLRIEILRTQWGWEVLLHNDLFPFQCSCAPKAGPCWVGD